MNKLYFVTSSGCEHCEQVREALNKLKQSYKLDVREVDMGSSEGMEFVLHHRIMLAPAIIFNDQLVSSGGISEENLRRKLDELKGDSSK